MYTKILLATDVSAEALKAATLAQKFEAQVVLLHVFNPAIVPVPFAGVPDLPLFEEDDMGKYAQKVQSEIEAETGKVLSDLGITYTSQRELGHPVERIVSVAHDTQADLIVMRVAVWAA